MKLIRNRPRNSADRDSHSRGIALAVVLVIMTILTLMGVVLILRTDSNMLGAKNEKEVAICRQAAEAATREGMRLSSSFYDTNTGTYLTSILGCTGTNDFCPPTPAELKPSFVVDYPGNSFIDSGCATSVTDPLCWSKRLFVGTVGVNTPSNVWVTVYARNNIDEKNAQVITDKDGRITIVGEAMMTFDGSIPLPDKSNVRVRKMIAADIIQPHGTSGCGSDVHNQNSNYGC